MQNSMDIETSDWNPLNDLKKAFDELGRELRQFESTKSNEFQTSPELDDLSRTLNSLWREFRKYWVIFQKFQKEMKLNKVENLAIQTDLKNSFPNPEDFLDSGGFTSNLQKAYSRKITMEGGIKFFDVLEFVKRKAHVVNWLIEGALFNRDFFDEFYQTDTKVSKKEGKTFIYQIVRDARFSNVKSEVQFNIQDLVNFFFYKVRTKFFGTELLFVEILQGDQENFNLYKETRDELIWTHFQFADQIITIRPKMNYTMYLQYLWEFQKLQNREKVKPDKNVYPLLLTWIFETLFGNIAGNLQSSYFVFTEALRLGKICQTILEEIKSSKFSYFHEDLEQIASLKLKEFCCLIQKSHSFHFQVSALREIWDRLGLDESIAAKYLKDYKTGNPSFNKLYQLQPDKDKKINF